MTSRIKIEQILLYSVLVGFIFPLVTSVAFIKVVTWNVPALVLLFWIVLRGVNRKRFRLHNFDLWEYSMVSIALIYMVMTLMGKEPLASFMFLSSYLYCFVLAIYFRRSYGTILTSRGLILFAFITVGLESVLGLIQQITSSEFGNLSVYIGQTPDSTELRSIAETDMGRIHGTLGTGNLVGSWINMFMPFIMYGSVYIASKRLWIWRNLTLLFGIISILITISRFNIALFVGILFFPLFLYAKNNSLSKISLKIKSSSFKFVALIILVGSITTITYWREVGMMKRAIEFRFSDTFEEASESGEKSSGVAARMEMNKGALQAFLRSPIIGVGFKNSRWIWPTVDADVPDNWVYQPHNLYMIMLVEGGIFLFASYLIFTLFPFYRLWRARKSNDPFLIAFFLSLSACIGIQMIYITFTSPNFTAVYMLIQGCAMGYTDKIINEEVVT